MKADCPICVEQLFEGELCACPCGHVFHKQCIQRWLTVQQTCPQCRIKVSFSSLLQLYFDTTLDTSQLVVLKESDAEIKKDLEESQKTVKVLQVENAKLFYDLHQLETSLSHQCTRHMLEKVELLDSLEEERTSNVCLKNQLKLMTMRKDEASKEVEHLQQQMSLYKNIYQLLSDENANDESIDKMTSNASNSYLKCYIKVLNQQLRSLRKKDKEQRKKRHVLEHKYKSELMQKREACKKLKELNIYLEEENKRLKSNLNDELAVKRTRFTSTPVINILSPVSNATITAHNGAKVDRNKRLWTTPPLANFNF